MKVLKILAAVLVLAAAGAAPAPTATPAVLGAKTASGIPLNAAWKVTIYNFARANLRHQVWGVEHSERNYHVSMELAKQEHMPVDEDVIFATAFLHDMDAFPAYSIDLPHGAGSAKEAEPMLRDAGFPMQKFAAVSDAMIGHMYYSSPAKRPEAIVMHDADTLEFIGAISIATTFGNVGDAKNLAAARAALEKRRATIPSKLITQTAHKIALRRIEEMNVYLNALDRETLGRTAE